jgi:hypothetical protein
LGEWIYSSTHSLTSALDGGEWSASLPGRFTPQGKSLWYPFDRRLGGPQSQSGHGSEEKNFQPLPGLEPLIIQSEVRRHYHRQSGGGGDLHRHYCACCIIGLLEGFYTSTE